MSENQLTQVDPVLKMSMETTATIKNPAVIPPTDKPTSPPSPSTPLQSSFIQRWQSIPTYTTTPTIPSTLPSATPHAHATTIPTTLPSEPPKSNFIKRWNHPNNADIIKYVRDESILYNVLNEEDDYIVDPMRDINMIPIPNQ
jgi:hypothetical protein